MRFDAPANLWFLAAVPVVVLFYILKARRRDLEVSSTFLWDDLLKDIEASRPWQRLRHNILMYLQILAVALLALGLARPVLLAGGALGRSTVLLIDGSASMRATDVAPDRFSVAKDKAAEIISAMRPQDSVAVVLVKEEPSPVVPLTREKREALDGLARAEAGYGSAALEPAMSLAKSMLSGRPAPRIVLLSDGGVESEETSLPSSIEFAHVACGSLRPTNAGIVSIGTKSGAQGVSVLVRVSNFGESETQAVIDISSGGLNVASRSVLIAAGGSESVTVDGLARTPYVTARLTSAGDTFALDDTAYALSEGDADFNILLVTRQNMFLEKSLALRPGARVYVTSPDDYTPSARYSLYVFDSWLPGEMPRTPILVFDPPGPVGPITPGASEKVGRVLSAQDVHQVMKFVDLQDVAINQGRKLSLGPGAQVLMTAGVPFAAAWETGYQKAVVVGFDVHESNMPLKPCFPVFVCNALEWLVPPPVTPGEHIAGRPLDLSLPAWVERAAVSGPGNAREDVLVEAGRALVVPGLPGLYTLEMSASGRTETVYFQAATPEPESRIALKPLSTTGSPQGSSLATGRPLWDHLAGIALAILALEWWIYARGA